MTRPPLRWDSEPTDLDAVPAATVRLGRAQWEGLGAVFFEREDHDGERPGLATGTVAMEFGDVRVGVLDYGGDETYVLLPDDAALEQSTALVLAALEDLGALEREHDVLDVVRAPVQPLEARVAELELQLATLASMAVIDVGQTQAGATGEPAKEGSSEPSGFPRGSRPGAEEERAPIDPAGLTLRERVVEINRVAKVVTGGRRFSFTALVVVGDENDVVGVGHGKAREVSLAVKKGVEQAKKNLFRVPKHGSTITHPSLGIYRSGRVLLKPASPGTGVVAGGGVRAVLELAGVEDVLSKSLGSQNPVNLVNATVAALKELREPEEVAARHGVSVNRVLGLVPESLDDDARPDPVEGEGTADPPARRR